MDNKDIIGQLSSLLQLDYDAVQGYNQALDEIDEPSIKSQISQYRDDHQRHISELSAAIRVLGSEPPQPSRDLKGFLMEGYAAVRSKTGTKGALAALHSAELITNRKYNAASKLDLPLSISNLIQKNYSDEKRHLSYVESQLKLVKA